MMRPEPAEGMAAVRDWLAAGGAPVAALRSRALVAADAERVVVEVSYDTAGNGAGSVIGKSYADGLGERTHARMRLLEQALAQAGAAAPRRLALPKALHYDRARRCLVQERAPGISLREAVKTERAAPAMRAVGAALAELHALPLPAQRVSGFGEHLRELIRPHPLALAEALPYLRPRIEAVLAEMEGLARLREAAVDPAPLHRDFHLGQLFLDDAGRVWLIDWDLFAWGDPLLDVGNFLMVLETRAGDRAPACRDAFLEGYGLRRESEARAIELYAAFNCLRRACKHFRLRRGDWIADVRAMLERAEQRLAAA